MTYLSNDFENNLYENSLNFLDNSFWDANLENTYENLNDEAIRPDFLISKTENFSYIATKASKNNESLTICNPNVINFPKQKKVEKKKLGRKTKNSREKGDHNEYSEDNLIRRSKRIFCTDFLEYINSKIEELEIELSITIDNKEYNVKKLLNLGEKITKDTSVDGNKALLKSPIKIILYEISKKYTQKPKNYNIVAIEELSKNEKCKEIRNILNLNYLDCLKYYRRDDDALEDDYLKCLNDLEKKFDQLPQDLKKKGYDKSYEEAIIDVIKDFENIYYNKKARKKRK
jgi:hypothetical protein